MVAEEEVATNWQENHRSPPGDDFHEQIRKTERTNCPSFGAVTARAQTSGPRKIVTEN